MKKITTLFSFSKFPAIVMLCFVLALLNSCKKTESEKLIQETGTVTDVENTVYKTVKIGNQWWMAENLNVRKYRNGDFITKVTGDTSFWMNDTVGAYCDIIDNSGNAIGKWYNWSVVANPKNIAPEGWHIPSDDDWKTLEKYLGMSQSEADHLGWRGVDEGDKLKEKGPLGWSISTSVWGNNESGFSAIANGCKLFNFKNGDPGQSATEFWWTSTSAANHEALYRYLDYKSSKIFRSNTFQSYGFSIRCVKD